MSNSENRPKWVRVSAVRKLTKGPVRVGTTFSNTVDMMGRKWESTLEVVEYEPLTTYAFMTESPFPCQLDHFFKPVSDGTEVTLRLQADYSGVSALARLLTSISGRRQLKSDLLALKNHLEGRVG